MSAANAQLELRVLGPMELTCKGKPVELPRSKKCRALLGYLAVTGREHRRERLCDLLWDVADDPRGGLRWTLSRLRSVLPKGVDLFEADRHTVTVRREVLTLDARDVAATRGTSLADRPTDDVEAIAERYRGELLEGLELPDFLEFSAWCVAEREELRRAHCDVLHELVDRLQETPARALPWARKLVQVDALDVHAHQSLLRLLHAEGFTEEAEHRYEHAVRQLREVGLPEAEALRRVWKALQSQPGHPRERAGASRHRTVRVPSADHAPAPFVGRRRCIDRVTEVIAAARATGERSAVLITGEPGAGKSRLLERLRSVALDAGLEVLSARALDLESGRPFGPWLDALGVDHAELARAAEAGGRTEVLARLSTLTAQAIIGKTGVLLELDDVQWLDRDSADALHQVFHGHTDGALVVLMGARGGELPDNAAASNVLRSLRRERLLVELEIEPLTQEELAVLIGDVPGLDTAAILTASAGNPLYALELSRGMIEGQEGPPLSLVQLVRERLSRLSEPARDVLRWASVLGYAFDADRLESLCDLPQMDLVDALEELERRALLQIDAARSRDRYEFGHDVVREAVYGELSHPRRRLMHRKVAHLLHGPALDPATAYEVARHASLAGEGELGVRACIAAGHYALRSCANADAEALARRGLHHATDLDEPSRVAATLDLLHVLYSARTPERAEAAERVRALAERALDLGLTKPARIGFQMLSYLRWESSSMADAHENILQAERVSRSSDPEERSQALAHAARCLVLLERNLGQAEAFAMEASGVAVRNGRNSAAVAFAMAMLAAHRGDVEEAAVAFREAQDLARADGERLAEFGALEHRLMLALDHGRDEDTGSLADGLVELGGRVRPGAEVAIARALHALVAVQRDGAAETTLSDAVTALREADAKYELSYVLTRWALFALSRGKLDAAADIAADGLEVARAVKRVSEEVIAAATIAEIAHGRGDAAAAALALENIEHAVESDLSAFARNRLTEVRDRLGD